MQNSKKVSFSYSEGIWQGFNYILNNYQNSFIIGQGLWSPWYVGNTMKDLEEIYGRDRVIDTPVSESATTGAAVGAALAGMMPVVVHPRIDFMLYAMDSIVNQAAKWNHMTGGQASVPLTVRGIINRGGEQGAQHSQALHSWFAHIPGLKVVMPYSPSDARDLLIASVLDPNPVIFIDDRWLYEIEEPYSEIKEQPLDSFCPKLINKGNDITIVSCGHSTHLAMNSIPLLGKAGISADIIDLRVLNQIKTEVIIDSLNKTGRLLVIDGGWSVCGISSEIIALVCEQYKDLVKLKSVDRLTIPFTPAPTSSKLEDIYYISEENIAKKVNTLINGER